MAYITKRTGDRSPFQVRWYEEGLSRSKRFRTEREAKRFAVDIERALELGAHSQLQVSTQTLGEWIVQWVAVDGVAWAKTTERQRTYILQRWCIPYIGRVRLKDLGVARLKSWRAEIIRAGASPATVNGVSRVVSAALGAAAEDGLIPANPMRSHGLRSLPQGPSNRSPVEVGDVEKIRAALEGPRDKVIVSIMAYCGLRPAEVLGLRWSDLSDDSVLVARSVQGGEIVATKTRRSRAVPLIAPVRDDVQAYRAVCPVARRVDALIFPSATGGPLVWNNWLRRAWHPAVRSLGIVAVPYELRHTFASLRIAEHRPVLEVSAWLGHASAAMTLNVYGHLFARAQMQAAESMEEAVVRARRHASDPVPARASRTASISDPRC